MTAPAAAARPLIDHAAPIEPAAYFELLMNITRREVKGRYSQTLFGIGWAIAQPLAMMAVFTSGTMSLVQYRNIVTKTYFPREIIPLAQISSRLIDLAAAAALVAVLMAYYRIALTRWALLVPALFVLLVAFTVAVTLLTSAVNVFYRDVNPVVQIGLQLWLYVTPIAYPLSKVPPPWRGWIAANPLTGVIEGLRSAVVYGREPDWPLLALSTMLTALALAGSFVLFKQLDRYFADVI
ncbi:MAG: hypothetical protein DMF93_07465 [Acidobacteria bacterium]|nr:MAG: hypothetical protein DMF93_07465 [Acidobacteriota bacterium]